MEATPKNFCKIQSFKIKVAIRLDVDVCISPIHVEKKFSENVAQIQFSKSSPKKMSQNYHIMSKLCFKTFKDTRRRRYTKSLSKKRLFEENTFQVFPIFPVFGLLVNVSTNIEPP